MIASAAVLFHLLPLLESFCDQTGSAAFIPEIRYVELPDAHTITSC